MGDDVGFQSQLHVMTELPSEFDAIIGMDWMINYDAWIHPATGRISAVLNDKESCMLNLIDFNPILASDCDTDTENCESVDFVWDGGRSVFSFFFNYQIFKYY
eukprot:SAG31_NODE_686_length_12815_cov_5.367175_1_plen_103_part_10